jgi:hypothetical protein
VKGILSEVDPDFKDRMATRQARLEAQAVVAAAAAKVARDKARADARAAAAEVKSKPTGKGGKDAGKKTDKSAPPNTNMKTAPKGKEPAKDKPTLPAKKHHDDDAHRAAKGLAKKKPR